MADDPKVQRGREAIQDLGQNDLSGNPFIAGQAIRVTVDTNKTVTLPFRIRGAIILESDVACEVQLFRITQRLSELKFTPTWEFMDRRDVDIDLSADFNFDVECRGDLDHNYMIRGYWLGGTGANDLLRWRVNNSGSSLSNEGSTYRYTDATGAGSDTSGLVIARQQTSETATEHYFETTLKAKSGEQRFSLSRTVQTWGTTTTSQEYGYSGGKWEDSAVQVTSIGLAFTSNNCLAGSWFELYRKREFDKTKVTLWVY